MFREGLLVVISGPSGTGKGTVLKLVQEINPNIRMSVSVTTRKPRKGEIDGQNYSFISVEEFKYMIENDELVEWVEYCGNFYGTPKKHIEDSTKKGFDVIFEIEVEGALNVKNKFADAISIFILPPSFSELRRRIEKRGTDSQNSIDKRLGRAIKEFDFVYQYDYLVINDNVENAVKDINDILHTEKLRANRNKEILKQIGV